MPTEDFWKSGVTTGLKIGALVYELDVLTEEEIATVEGREHSTSSSTDYSERGFSDRSALGHGMVVGTDGGPMRQRG